MVKWKHKSLLLLFGWKFLILYLILSFGHIILAIRVINDERFFDLLIMTISIMTGGDPFTFRQTIVPYPTLWALSWVLHLASWIIIPIIAGIIVNDVMKEVVSIKLLEGSLHAMLSDKLHPGEVDEAVESILNAISAEVDKLKKE